nr:hypothetical protein [Victivallales bacterium]
VADALDRSHNSKFMKLNVKSEPGRILFSPESNCMDLAAESLALKTKSDLFIDTYGIKPEFI